MDETGFAAVVVVALVLVNVALILVVFGQSRAAGQQYPADVKHVLGALAAVAVFFAVRSENKVDDVLIGSVLVPVFKLLGVDVPVIGRSGVVDSAAPVPPAADGDA